MGRKGKEGEAKKGRDWEREGEERKGGECCPFQLGSLYAAVEEGRRARS